MTNRLNQIKQVIDLDKVKDFITSAREVADAVESIFNSSKTDDDKLVEIFNSCVKLGLYDVSDLPKPS